MKTIRSRFLPGMAFLLCVVLMPPVTLSQGSSVEDQAALILYQSGRDKFKAEDYQGAATALRKAFGLSPNVFSQYYLGLSLERIGQCEEALPNLVALAGKLAADQELLRRGSHARCILSRAESLSKEGDCPAVARELETIRWPLDQPEETRRGELAGSCIIDRAIHLKEQARCREALNGLKSLTVPLSPRNESRKALATRECESLIAGFKPSSTLEQAAFMLVLEGTALVDAGQVSAGIQKLEKALIVLDEPHIHLHLARAYAATSDCKGATRHAEAALKALPELRDQMKPLQNKCPDIAVPGPEASRMGN